MNKEQTSAKDAARLRSPPRETRNAKLETPASGGRPRMPGSYGVDPASVEGTLPWSYVSERMASARNYWVGTTRPNGQPHAAPVWGVWLDESFYFATDPASRKGANLAANPPLVVHLERDDEVVILEGAAEKVTDPILLARFADAYEAKYQFRPEVNSSAAVGYRLRPRVAFAWRERDFPTSATRWSLDQIPLPS